jgi:hypothetical protein
MKKWCFSVKQVVKEEILVADEGTRRARLERRE